MAVNYRRAVLVVVTGLEQMTADPKDAGGAVWRRLGCSVWPTLADGVAGRDGDRRQEMELK